MNIHLFDISTCQMSFELQSGMQICQQLQSKLQERQQLNTPHTASITAAVSGRICRLPV